MIVESIQKYVYVKSDYKDDLLRMLSKIKHDDVLYIFVVQRYGKSPFV